MRVLLVFFPLLLLGCGGTAPRPSETPTVPERVPQMTTSRVEVESMPEAEVTAPAKVEANPNRVSHIKLSAPGKVSQVPVRLGDPVQQGQALLTVVSAEAVEAQGQIREAEAAVRQAQAGRRDADTQVIKARNSLRQAQLDYRRVKELFEHEAIAYKEVQAADTQVRQCKADLEASLASVELADAEIQSARAGERQARERLELLGVGPDDPHPEIVVRSPLTGKVLELSVVAGEYFSDTSASVMVVADLSSVWVTSSVPENSIRLIETGEPVTITLDAFPGEQLPGRVTRIADVLDAKTRTVKVMTELANPRGRFRPEMFGRIRHVHGGAPSPVVPVRAVVQRGNGSQVVFVEKSPGDYEERTVSTGARRGDKVAVHSGLSPGERVVVDGAVLLRK